jgi:mRNA-degrading endonuclease toxin of MazEF toxin-antitoxin module
MVERTAERVREHPSRPAVARREDADPLPIATAAVAVVTRTEGGVTPEQVIQLAEALNLDGKTLLDHTRAHHRRRPQRTFGLRG